MSFTSIEFILFTVLVILLYFILPKKVQWIVPLDSVAVNTRYPGSKVAHRGNIYSYLRNYEEYQMKHFDYGSVMK